MTQTIKKCTRKAWAIRYRFPTEKPFLLGYGYFGWERPKHLSGYVTATFRTRKEAVEIAKELNSKTILLGKYSVVRVSVTVG